MIKCVKYTPYTKEGSYIIGFADFDMEKWGGTFRGCPVYQKEQARWVSFPGKEYVKEDGSKGFNAVFVFNEKQHLKYFSEEAKKAIDLFVRSK